MNVHKLAGKPAPHELPVNIPRLISAYYTHKPDTGNPHNMVSFGTSGHRGLHLKTLLMRTMSFICQAICELKESRDITGPLYVGMDTHALSEAAFATAIEVFAGKRISLLQVQSPHLSPF